MCPFVQFPNVCFQLFTKREQRFQPRRPKRKERDQSQIHAVRRDHEAVADLEATHGLGRPRVLQHGEAAALGSRKMELPGNFTETKREQNQKPSTINDRLILITTVFLRNKVEIAWRLLFRHLVRKNRTFDDDSEEE